MRLLTRTALTSLCALSVLGLAACGSDDDTSSAKPSGPFANMSGPQIANKAMSTTKKAKSMRIAVQVKSEDGPVSADFTTNTAGDCTGTMHIGAGKMDILKTGSTVYTKFDEKMLREQSKGEPKADTDAAVDMLAGHWLKSKATDADTKDTLEFCDLSAQLKDFETNDSAARKAGETTVDGTRALRLTEKDDEGTYTILVAAEGKPYLLRVESKGKEPMTMKLSGFDEPVVVEAPAAKDIVDPDHPAG